MAKTAFIVLKSPQELDPAHGVRRLASGNEASVILLEDGVYQALAEEPAQNLKNAAASVLVSKDDLEARGFSEPDLKVGKAAGYPEIVDCIMEQTERTVTL